MKNISDNEYVGVIGAGSFGLVIATILSENSNVLIYARRQEVVDEINQKRHFNGIDLGENITAISDLEMLASKCRVIFPIVPSSNFREMMRELAPFLYPYHIMIHGTKGLDHSGGMAEGEGSVLYANKKFTRDNVKTMSEVIKEESSVVRIGCLSGPNLAKELADKQPAATVVASSFDEVILEGQRLLRNDRFMVYGSKDLIGVELTGVLKNILAIASGMLSGLGYGENAKGLLISRGLVEMIYVGKVLGGNMEAFIGLAGIGDIVTTCSSKLSRNYTVGYRLAQGESVQEIIGTMDEVAEGVNTIEIVKHLAENYPIRVPITEALYKVIKGERSVADALKLLMKLPFYKDIDFM
ncbi:glycerol-3-phosphate dehydrogenase (NAD(P)+) [Aureibacter tunicatorum]|uniref:Glycerol-3-phosphate dehydrogenase [NAD(P)+] n=1 Tax=Aureibacter tunicatorum TaxID=866807 RepID=A0AAE3XS28_9BACT|nr:glycerol-3-phosphate dehydrogenase (NAD(P)+) [Aureibacter tunicatorum]